MAAQRNYAVSPGSYLKEWLEDEGITQDTAAARLDVSRKTVSQIVRGGNVSSDLAYRLGRVTPIDQDVWLRIQAQYDSDRERLRQEHSIGEHIGRISKQVRKFLKDHSLVESDGRNPGKFGAEFLSLHRVATWDALDVCTLEPLTADNAMAFRTETRKSSLDPIALATWLRACELSPEMELLDALHYSEADLRDLLPALRQRASTPDLEMFRDLSAMLREVGVVLTAHEAPANFPLHGVTRWEHGVPVIHQTLRQRRDGFVIFTLFHELGHVFLDVPGELHLDEIERGPKDRSEKNANDFAWDLLLPSDRRAHLRTLTTDDQIRRAARELGVAPGVLVFYLHRTRALPFNYSNNLYVSL